MTLIFLWEVKMLLVSIEETEYVPYLEQEQIILVNTYQVNSVLLTLSAKTRNKTLFLYVNGF